MKLTTLDKIVRSALADKGYPMHWYVQFLGYAVTCLRELNFDVLQNIKSARLPVNSYKACTLPIDYVDVVRVGDEYGQYLNPWGEKHDSFNRLNRFDAYGNKIAYNDVELSFGNISNSWERIWYVNRVNDKGESLGRIYNSIPAYRNSYSIIRERNEIQLDVYYSGTEIVMDYISDGMTLSASNNVHPYAIETIKAYIFWQHKLHGRQFNSGERMEMKMNYDNQLRLLRGRMNPIDVNDIIRSLRKNTSPVIKN